MLKCMIQHLRIWDGMFCDGLFMDYMIMNDAIHRFLPKNGQKMNWRSSVHAVVAEAASK